MRQINKLIIHCSDTEGPETGATEAIRRYHMYERGYSDIGYHFVIERSGEVKYGRPEATPGAHCKGANKHSIGICLVGKKTFRPAQLKSLTELMTELLEEYGLPVTAIAGHQDFASAKAQGKTCPNIPTEILQKLVIPF